MTGKTDRGSKDVASFSIRVVLSKKSGRTSYKNPVRLWDLGRSPVHLPVDASSFNEEIEPLIARRTNLLKKVRVWAQSRTEVGTMNLRTCARSAASRT